MQEEELIMDWESTAKRELRRPADEMTLSIEYCELESEANELLEKRIEQV